MCGRFQGSGKGSFKGSTRASGFLVQGFSVPVQGFGVEALRLCSSFRLRFEAAG